ncbi:MAG: LptE family protein [Bacteroidaceae bacterium]|nr:LptE family protein [Bacteroidaceae bacterium]
MKNRILIAASLFMVLTAISCLPSYKLNGASIDYNTIKTISIENFQNRATYQWAPMAPMFNNSISDIYNHQTKLRQVKRDGDLVISGEITSYDQTNKSIAASGYSSMVQLKMSVKVKFVNTKHHDDDFEKSFSATREYDSSQQLASVQEELVQQMIDDIVDQIFNATVANW